MVTTTLLMDGYGYSHLTSHLARAGDVDKLYHLVTNSKWRRSSQQFDGSLRRYRNDIDIASRSTESSLRVIIQASGAETLVEMLSRLPALGWISASLGQQATRRSHYLLEAIARAGNSIQALDRAANIPLPVRRAECMTWIGLGTFDRGEKDFARQIWKETIQLLETVPSDFLDENLETLGELVCILAHAGEKEWAAALNAKFQRAVQREIEHAGGITSTARLGQIKAWLSLSNTQAARNIINKIEDAQDRLNVCLDALEFQVSLRDSIYTVLLDPAELANKFLGEAAKRQRLAAVLAGFGQIKQAWKIFQENPDEITRSWILRSYIVFLLRENDESNLSIFIDQAIKTILAIPEPAARLRHCADFLLGRQRDSLAYLFTGILPAMQKDFDNLSKPLDPWALEMVALAFSLLNDVKRTDSAAGKALSPEVTMDDWDETNTQIVFARFFGETKDNTRFQQLFDYAVSKEDLWQKAELLIAIESYSFSLDDKELWKKTVNLLEKISEDGPALTNRPNTLGAIAAWKYREGANGTTQEVQSVFEKASMLLKDDDDRADGLAHLALTLALNGLSDQIDYSLNEAFEVLHSESDPNTLARVTGTMTEVAVYSGRIDILIQLEKIAELISDEWLQAEALFWISHGNALLGNERQACKLFLQAVKHGAWDEIELDQVENSWSDPASAEAFHSQSNYIGWHSTKVAANCAWLTILLMHPKPWHLSTGLQLTNDIPEEYSEKRSFCISLIATAAKKLSSESSALLRLYIDTLTLCKGRHVGEVWAVLHACLPYLEKYVGHEFIRMTWDNLHQVRKGPL